MAIILIGILNLFWCSLHAQFKAGCSSAGYAESGSLSGGRGGHGGEGGIQ